eukprot:scaffold26027_cov70-Attheya_sp.AAC.14
MATVAAVRGLRGVASAATSRFTVARTAASSSYLLDTYQRRWMSSYPSHEVVGMPSLSPVRRK